MGRGLVVERRADGVGRSEEEEVDGRVAAAVYDLMVQCYDYMSDEQEEQLSDLMAYIQNQAKKLAALPKRIGDPPSWQPIDRLLYCRKGEDVPCRSY